MLYLAVAFWTVWISGTIATFVLLWNEGKPYDDFPDFLFGTIINGLVAVIFWPIALPTYLVWLIYDRRTT